MAWIDFERPGYFGRKRDDVFTSLNTTYGEGNWRISWKWLGQDVDFRFACNLYEDAYYADSFKIRDLWQELIGKASNVYDIDKEDVLSGFDYELQKGKATHLQDIAIRRVVARRGWKFKGNDLVQIRGHKTYWGSLLSPGKVMFHLPEHIIPGIENKPEFNVWWDRNSVEDFYQSNKYIQIREVDPNNLQSLLDERDSLTDDFSRREASFRNSVGGINKLLEPRTQKEFAKIIKTINEHLQGKAPKIEDFRVRGNYVDLKLDCGEEELDEEGDIIKQTVRQILDQKGLSWIHAGFSPYYYSK